MRRTITGAEFQEQVNGWARTAQRAELQPRYWVAGERAAFDRFVAGKQSPGSGVAGTRAWLDRIEQRAAAGQFLSRIRVHSDPPSDYQRWLRIVSEEYQAAGEQISYLTYAQADAAHLLGVAARDWWLFDDERLVVLTHDEEGRRIHTELITGSAEIERAREWWSRAVRVVREVGA